MMPTDVHGIYIVNYYFDIEREPSYLTESLIIVLRLLRTVCRLSIIYVL